LSSRTRWFDQAFPAVTDRDQLIPARIGPALLAGWRQAGVSQCLRAIANPKLSNSASTSVSPSDAVGKDPMPQRRGRRAPRP
jgi:hypothetical protein